MKSQAKLLLSQTMREKIDKEIQDLMSTLRGTVRLGGSQINEDESHFDSFVSTTSWRHSMRGQEKKVIQAYIAHLISQVKKIEDMEGALDELKKEEVEDGILSERVHS